jgi:hypothetical protein
MEQQPLQFSTIAAALLPYTSFPYIEQASDYLLTAVSLQRPLTISLMMDGNAMLRF